MELLIKEPATIEILPELPILTSKVLVLANQALASGASDLRHALALSSDVGNILIGPEYRLDDCVGVDPSVCNR